MCFGLAFFLEGSAQILDSQVTLITCQQLGLAVSCPFPLPNSFSHSLYDVFPGIVNILES